jgi:hypothetical protein
MANYVFLIVYGVGVFATHNTQSQHAGVFLFAEYQRWRNNRFLSLQLRHDKLLSTTGIRLSLRSG